MASGATQASAFHESGHCIIGVSLGITPVSVCLREGGGLTCWQWDGCPSLHKRLMILAGGWLAETLHGFADREWAAGDDDSQAVQAIGMARRVPDSMVGDPWSAPEGRAACHEARAILRSRRAQVAALAERLLIYRQLTGAEIIRLLATLPVGLFRESDASLGLARRRLALDAAQAGRRQA